MKDEEKKGTKSWFWKLFLNNQFVSALLIILLCLAIILVFTKVSHLFTPVVQFIGIIGSPVLVSGILFYLLNPIVDFMEKKGLSRTWGISLIFIIVLLLVVWGIVILVPEIQSQIVRFLNNWPSYWQTIQEKSNELLNQPLLSQYADNIESAGNDFMQSLGSIIQSLSKNTFQGIGSVIGVVTTIFLTIATAPVILFYLLRDGSSLGDYVVQFFPNKAKKPVMKVLIDMNKQVSQYIRGQLTVAFVVGLIFMLGFKLINLDFAVTLGILAGFLNLVPYLGSFLAMIPAILLGIVTGPTMLVKVLIVFALEQFLEGRFVSPLVLGSQLKIHPVTIIFVLLTSGKLFGVVGVVIGVPAYAAIKVLVTHVFDWYKEYSGLYEPIEIEEKHTPEN